jgi:predicted transcriptional regulator
MNVRAGEDIGLYPVGEVKEKMGGAVRILLIPGIQKGGSRSVDYDRYRKTHFKLIGWVLSASKRKLHYAGFNAVPDTLYGVKQAAV